MTRFIFTFMVQTFHYLIPFGTFSNNQPGQLEKNTRQHYHSIADVKERVREKLYPKINPREKYPDSLSRSLSLSCHTQGFKFSYSTDYNED